MKARARDGWLLLALWVGFSLLGEGLVSLAIRNYPLVAAVEGEVSDAAIFYLLRWVVPVATAVILVLVYAPWRFRAAAGDSGDAAMQSRGHAAVSWLWFLISAALVISFVFYPGVTGLREIWASQAAENPLEVDVLAKQWEWRFDYPQLGISDAKELMLPLDRTVKFNLTSEDVIHSFWIPSLRIKKDVIPGQTRTLYLTPNQLTSTEASPLTRVQCAELCGVGHARMRAAASVVSAQDFRAWVEAQGGQLAGWLGAPTLTAGGR